MSSAASHRAASNADRRGVSQQIERRRPASIQVPNGDNPKAHVSRGGFGVNASEKRADRRTPFRPSDEGHPKTARPDLTRVDPSPQTSRRVAAESGRASWSPQASLISTSTAPLAARVSIPPLSSFAPKQLQPPALGELSLVDQEVAILEDLLYVLMGFEGQYIRYSDSYNPLEEKERLAGPDFRIVPGLDLSFRDLTYSMLHMAKHYIALEAFIEVQSREEFGTVNHALCAAIRKLLKDYLILAAQLEHQLLTNDNFSLNILNLHTKSTSHMLLQLFNLAQDILKKNSILEEDDDSDNMDDVDNIIESLREGADVGQGIAGRKVCKGGSVLGLITKRLASMSGDPAARALLTSLLREASRPYMTMLNEWLHHGAIKDAHGEFLIREQQSIKREGLEQDYTDEYWEKRYTVREPDVPPQLEGVKDKVLLAGKYLNVVRECGGVDIGKEVSDVPKSFDDPRFLDNVNSAYAFANSSLLTLLLTTHALPARLRSLKHYFFLDRSDFFSYFLELSNSELRKPVKAVNTGKLQSLLEIVLRQPGSVASEDPYKEDVKVQMNELGLTSWLMRVVNVTGLDQDAANTSMTNLVTPAAPTSEDKDLKGFDALVLDYAVPFPISLVVSRVTLTRYQLLFRYLLSLRHLETLLLNSWNEQSKTVAWRHRSSNKKIEAWKRKAWTLHSRMLVFVQQLLYFCTAEVIEPNWQALMSKVNERQDGSESTYVKRTVDELMQDHVDFLATCLKECMLTNSKLLRINSKVTNTCTLFASFTSSFSRYLAAADADFHDGVSPGVSLMTNRSSKSGPTMPSVAYEPQKLDKFIDTLQRYETHFSRYLKTLLDALNYLAATETVVFLGLCARLSNAIEGDPNVMGDGQRAG
ncbi:MAG: hypothetical protein M1828_002893 [Chrysothrix sp. TS-e1954]|nr:MAG: hypothetical protein M1828_002893 [Chrysothrix sp. TS-e1954]